jgi:prepilin-type N-terminal cleavage/methylation domain-containing protein
MASQPGMTLIELTVVIFVLLSLASLVFTGARMWKRSSDRTLCIMNLQNVQKGVRAYANLYGLQPGQSVLGLRNKVIGLGRLVETEPACPSNGTYDFADDLIPSTGVLYMNCSLSSSGLHDPANHSDW